ncbi:hypothetical protein EC968_005179 [Mortierella alpina]|nr:hypothetical protein EC968_005179 [Mortierella alpina]
MPFRSLSPLDLPMVLEEIGTFLGPSDLCACALVNRHWHVYFAPFLYWLALEDCDAIVKRLYDINIARPLKRGDSANFETAEFNPNYRLQADYLAHIDALLERIKRSSSIHRESRRVLASLSYRSFIILGTLCDNIRRIDFTFCSPESPPSPGPEVSPEVYAMSTQHMLTQQRPDRVTEVLERTLKRLRLGEIIIRSSDHNENCAFLDPHPDAHPALEELYIFRPNTYPIQMQMDLARLQPNLRTFHFTCDKLESPLRFAPGFHTLTKLSVGVSFAYSIAPIVQAAHRLEHLRIEGRVMVDEALGATFRRHRWTLTTLVINCYVESTPTTLYPPGSLNGAENPLHLILRHCHALKHCVVLSPVLDCNPVEFEQPWACNEIEKLTIIPDCKPKVCTDGQSSYTPLQAQYAFYLQLSRFKSLKILGFGGGVGSRSFNAESYLELLCGLDELEVLNLHSNGLDSSAQVTIEHAVLVAKHWPRLKAIHGLYHYVCRPFVEYVKTHRPDVDLRY